MARQDNNRTNRLEKALFTAAGVTVGATLLHKGGGTKYISKALGDMSETMSKVSKDFKVAGRKNLTAEKLTDIFKKRIANDDSTWKIARREAPKLDIKNHGLFKELRGIDNLQETFNDIKNKNYDSQLRENIMNVFDKRFKDLKERDREFMKSLYNLTDESLKRQDMFFEKGNEPGTYKAMIKEFQKAVKGTKLEGHENEIADVLKDALENSGEIRDRMENLSTKVKDEIKDEYINAIKNKYKTTKDKGDRAATALDVYNALQEEKARVKNDFDAEMNSFLNEVKGMLDKNPEFGDLAVDPKRYRMDAKDQFYSIEDLRKIEDKTKEAFADTIGGKLFGVRNFVAEAKAPTINYMPKGTYDPGLAKLLGTKDLLNENMISIGDKFYKVTKDGLKHFEKADGRVYISGREGSLFGLMDRLAGNSAYKPQDNAILDLLDINTKGGDFLSEVASRFTKFSSEEGHNWGRNLSKRLLSNYDPKNYTGDDIREFYNDMKQLSSLYNEKTRAVSPKAIENLKKVFSEDAIKVLETLNTDDPLTAVMSSSSDNLINKDLASLYNKISKDELLKETMTRTSKDKKRIIKYDEILNREILKEAIFRDISSNKAQNVSGYSITLSKIMDSGISKNDVNNLKDIMNWGILQEKGGVFSRDAYLPKTISQKEEAFLSITSMLKGDNENFQEKTFLKEFKESIVKFTNDNTSIFDKIDVNKNVNKSYAKPQWMTVNKTTSVLDIIKSINDETKSTEKESINFVRQFIAGRKNIDEVSHMTMLPFHMINRLTTPLESFGLGFSNASTASAMELATSIATKRILPAMAIATAASYLNYESEKITGTSFTQAYQSTKAQIGLGVKTILSPFDNYLKKQSDINPMADYLFGEYRDKEEYEDYLENGYDPVRKGRFWSFGSASEFRGGKISYWEPNKLRQAYSNYRDIAIYGSSDEKWKHSLIPTLRYPLSPIRYLMNPYWLEEMHSEDRPYPVSGKMFSEGTPWGAILNPTIGELIKPQKKMHQRELGGTLLDVRDIIRERNNEIKDKAQENRLIRIDESGFTPMVFRPDSMPTMNEAIYNISVENGRVNVNGFDGQAYAETMDDISTAEPAFIAPSGYDRQSGYQVATKKLGASSSYEDQIASGWITGISMLAGSGAISGGTAIKMIGQVNSDIRTRAEVSQRGEWFEKANLYKDPYRKESYRRKLDFMEDMVEFNTKKDFIDDMLYSTKQLSGMYGFLFEQVSPGSQSYRLEQAGKMSSFTRQFWDESVGGIGGNIMEIARRFFPHEDHSRTDINPIRNTMPEWMPERFLNGDPYTKVTKGEARLPGAGYEALNKLHPDKYGAYGSFDRYKILADIAPLSEEYKTWKKIAKSEIQDPALKKEMEQIESRVKEQVKEHDFYNYRFLGKKMAEHVAVIEEVSNTGKFKIMGSSQEFNLAGIKVLKDEEGNSQVHNYLKPGMKVRLSFEDNSYSNVDAEGRISAIVNFGSQNINKEMEESGAAKEKETMETLADQNYKLNDLDNFKAHIYEAIAHAPIPFIHNKFLRVDSSLESYKKEQVYGSPYSTWDHPIKGFLKPSLQQAFEVNPIHQALGIGAFALSEYMLENSDNKMLKNLADTAFALTNPGAFTGGVIGAIPKMKISDDGIWNARNGARIGATIGLAGYALTNTQNPYLSMANFAALGYAAQEQLKFTGVSSAKGALIGAGLGLVLSSLNPESKLSNIYERYIPDDTEKKWEIEEYYDRLEYIKYTKLFHEAARVAKRKEGVDIHRIVSQYESNKEKNSKMIEKLEKQKLKAEKMIDERVKEEIVATIDQKINELLTPIQYLKGGEYTKAAIAYKKAADTTIYGLSEDSSVADVLRSLPKYDRDYFLDFANEKDPKERKKILKYVSPYKAKALKVLWGEEVDEQKSNKDFFSAHSLPNMFWSGWKNNVDLEHVKMKTIENEGMLLSDFGIYESSKNDPSAVMAPEIKEINKSIDPLSLQANMLTLLNGVGFSDVNVSVERSQNSGIRMVANVSRLATYELGGKVNSIMSNLIL